MLTRFLKNPILKPKKEHPWESKLVFNPGAVYHDGLVHLIYRAIGDDNISRIGYAVSPNGYEFYRVDKPVYTPRGILECKGCEDPRLVYLDNRFYMTYIGYSPRGPRVSLASTRNFFEWKRYGVILPDQDNKDAVFFPKKINDKYVMFHRPMAPPRSIWIAFSENLIEWHDSKKVMTPIEGRWDGIGIGTAGPPVKTDKGWLLLYHGIDEASVYRLGVALFDLNDPSVLIGRYSEFIFEPEEDYELRGEVNEIVFPTGICEIKDKYYIYYGAADKYVCGATIEKNELLSLFK